MGRTHGLWLSVSLSLRHRKRKAKGSPVRRGRPSSRTSSRSRDRAVIILSLQVTHFLTFGSIYPPETNKSSPNTVDNGETDRNLREKNDHVEYVFPDGEIFDYTICFLHFAVCLFCIHPKILPCRLYRPISGFD